ncbi:hypothetical protein G7Y89_g4355 [Cudoniella acicularis]|uniref:Zn(2)-C6 fungal-type domain-containing protein n=1 Tax=Cudoniella acicularis TaxID=354080 RepID=A0A8H4RPN7_9HELO|nr:hypothetical protein G7Y89_g4355 [Cudoniella acicularis]
MSSEEGYDRKEKAGHVNQDVGDVAIVHETLDGELKRPLKPRHIQMIAIGGVIGTGLFLGTAGDLENGGPAGLLIGYCIMASLLYSVMVALGEMVSQFPIAGGQFALAGRFVAPELGFAMGWLYWYNYIIVLPAEISAAAVLISYWTPAGQVDSTCTTGICNNAMWIGLMLIVVWAINFGGTRVFGEMEFWFCSIKVITILGLIITGVVITAGGGPNHESIGFRFWNETGGFVQYGGIAGVKGRFLGFFSVLISAAFAFIGTEITAIAAAETANPRRSVPRAIKSVWIRLVLFYLCSAFLIGMLVSPTDPSLNLSSTAAKSPFVIAIKNAGLSVLPSIINAALLTSAWSAGCADLFVSSRALYGLAARGQAPNFLRKTRKDDLPWLCVLVGVAFSLLSFMAASKGKAGTAFGYFSNMTAICGMISWTGILWTSIRWHKGLKAQGIDRNTLPYRAPFQPYLSYYGISVAVMVTIFGGFTSFIHKFDASSFITTYFPIPFFAVLFFGYKLWNKSKIVDSEDGGQPSKMRRISRACLQCRTRKQRCLPSSETAGLQAPCKRCQQHDITCSFEIDQVPGPESSMSPLQMVQLVVDLRRRTNIHETRIAELERLRLAEGVNYSSNTEINSNSTSRQALSPPGHAETHDEHTPRGDSAHFFNNEPQAVHPRDFRALSEDEASSGSRAQDPGHRSNLNSTLRHSCDPVSRGIISPHDAQKAINIYFEHCHPCAPVLSENFRWSALELRTSSPTLFLSVCSVGARFWSENGLHPNFLGLTSLLDMAVSRLILRPTPSDVNLDSIRVLLLYAQWMPCAPENDDLSPSRAATSRRQPKSRYNDISAWAVLGLAFRYAIFLGLDRSAIAPFQKPTKLISEEDFSRLRVWHNLLTCDCNLVLTSGLPGTLDPTPAAKIGEVFGSHLSAQQPADLRVSALVELAVIVHRATRNWGDFSGRKLDAFSLRKANTELEDWERSWIGRLQSQHNQLPFTSVRWYRLALNSASLGPHLSPVSHSQPQPLQIWLLQALETCLTAASQMLFSLSNYGAEHVWRLESQNTSTFPSGPFPADPDALRRLYYAVDSTWISHTFAVAFLVLCYVRGMIDDDLRICNITPIASLQNSAPFLPRHVSVLARLVHLAVDIFNGVCQTPGFHPAHDFNKIVQNASSLVLAPEDSSPRTGQEYLPLLQQLQASSTTVSFRKTMLSTLATAYENTCPPAVLRLRGGNAALESIQDGTLLIKPVMVSHNSVFGAEVFGVDWSRPVAPEIVKQLIALQDKYAILIFRKTGLDNERHIAFSQQLGEKLETNPFYAGRENDRVGEPFLFDVSNIEIDGELVKPDSRRWHHSLGNALWHTDSSYHQQRAKYSILLSHGNPSEGGSWTHFADTRRAYADLPQEKKDELENLVVEHDLWHSRKLGSSVVYQSPTPAELAAKPPAYHRLVQIAPDGRKTLYLAAHAKGILGRSFEESQKLIWELIDHCTQPKYVFSMEWLEGGDMVWWDNRQSMHRANPYTVEMTARDVRRSTICDDSPLAFGVTEEEKVAAGWVPSPNFAA